jgi:hypothetical protein
MFILRWCRSNNDGLTQAGRDALQKYPQAKREVVETYTRWILVIYEVKGPKG